MCAGGVLTRQSFNATGKSQIVNTHVQTCSRPVGRWLCSQRWPSCQNSRLRRRIPAGSGPSHEQLNTPSHAINFIQLIPLQDCSQHCNIASTVKQTAIIAVCNKPHRCRNSPAIWHHTALPAEVTFPLQTVHSTATLQVP